MICALAAAALVVASPAGAAAPNYIIVAGPLLERPILLDAWHENLELLLSTATAPRATAAAVRGLRSRPRLDLAEFWGWEGQRPSRARDANQHGWFYPARGKEPPVIDLMADGVRVPRVAPTGVLRILARHRVPTRVAGSKASASTVTPCRSVVRHDVVPVWARAGFSDPNPRVPYVRGRSGRIVAIVFGYPLRSPPANGRNNKILWVPRTPAKAPAALWIRAVPMDGTRTLGAPVRQVIAGGPGPSIVDLPAAGCWRLTLSWSGRTDSLDLEYG